MKYALTFIFATSLSFGAFALGESNANSQTSCCPYDDHRCGEKLPTCPKARVNSNDKVPEKTGKSNNIKGKSGNAVGF